MLLLLGPWVDSRVSGRWLGSYTMTQPATGVLLLSCLFSVGVNVSHFMCLGRFTAATFQVGAAVCAVSGEAYLQGGFKSVMSRRSLKVPACNEDLAHIINISSQIIEGFEAPCSPSCNPDADTQGHACIQQMLRAEYR